MASALYDKGREGIADRTIDLTGDVRAMLVKTAYVLDIATHDFLADIGANDNGRTAALGTKTYTGGVFDAADTTLSALAADPSEALVIFQHTGSDATARLIAYIDTATGLPFTPAIGQVIPITWDGGANKIFKL